MKKGDGQKMGTVAFYTLGCKLNQFETEAIREQFVHRGFRVVEFSQPADVYVVNTCTVTGRSDYHARQMIRRAARLAPRSFIVAVGCYAQRDPEALAQLTGVGLVLGNREKVDLFRYLAKDQKINVSKSDLGEHHSFLDISQFSKHTRAFVKIQDGCDGGCSYCIVPHVRGPSRCRPIGGVVHQVKALSAVGYREIVLTGVHIGRFQGGLAPLVRRVKDEVQRLRLSSIEPQEVSLELVDLLASSKKMCHHLHLPLQSGDDEILKKMGRGYDSAFYAQLVERLAQEIPGVGLGADVLVGFPGETEEQFRRTHQLVQRLPLAYLHVFNYSRRPGTAAAALPNQVNPEVRRSRSKAMRELGQRKWEGFRRSFIGRCLTVLVESRREETGLLTGLADNYIRVNIEGEDNLMNQFVEVKVVALHGRGVRGEIARKRWVEGFTSRPTAAR